MREKSRSRQAQQTVGSIHEDSVAATIVDLDSSAAQNHTQPLRFLRVITPKRAPTIVRRMLRPGKSFVASRCLSPASGS